ncbi:hypothetical protein, partial [Paenibacillus sp. P3E]|uniref:hypothetical protein n=1 Tax=Paenibacillus sp. P3E TaxID=1349435 RepID=UPI000AC34181
NVFFMYSQEIANSFYEETVQKYKEELPKYKIIVQKNSELDWPIAESMFFKPYYKEPIDLVLVDDINSIYESSYEKNKTIILAFDFPKKKFINVTTKIEKGSEISEFNVQKNLINDFSKATISPGNIDLPTPNGKGGFILDENDINFKGSNPTIISNYSVLFDEVKIGLRNKLFVSYYMPYEISDGAKVKIEISDGNDKHIIYEKDVLPEGNLSSNKIDLKPYEGKIVGII